MEDVVVGEKGRGEVEKDEGGEENGPNEEDVDGYVHGVAVVRAVEREVLLQIQHPHFPC